MLDSVVSFAMMGNAKEEGIPLLFFSRIFHVFFVPECRVFSLKISVSAQGGTLTIRSFVFLRHCGSGEERKIQKECR